MFCMCLRNSNWKDESKQSSFIIGWDFKNIFKGGKSFPNNIKMQEENNYDKRHKFKMSGITKM